MSGYLAAALTVCVYGSFAAHTFLELILILKAKPNFPDFFVTFQTFWLSEYVGILFKIAFETTCQGVSVKMSMSKIQYKHEKGCSFISGYWVVGSGS